MKIKVINYELYQTLKDKIEDYISSGINWKSNSSVEKTINERINGLLKGFDNSSIKSSIKDLWLRQLDQEEALRRIIIFKYTRESNLVLEIYPGTKSFYKMGMRLKDIKESE